MSPVCQVNFATLHFNLTGNRTQFLGKRARAKLQTRVQTGFAWQPSCACVRVLNTKYSIAFITCSTTGLDHANDLYVTNTANRLSSRHKKTPFISNLLIRKHIRPSCSFALTHLQQTTKKSMHQLYALVCIALTLCFCH